MQVKAYALRHQKAGILTDSVYLESPSEEHLVAAKAILDRVHSTDGWLRVVPVALVLPDSFADIAHRFEAGEKQREPEGKDGASGVAEVGGPKVSIIAHVETP